MNIGYINNDYPNIRNIKNIVPHVQYVKVHNTSALTNRTAQQNPFDITNTFTADSLHNIDLIHFFNVISLDTTPWITTFETLVPRFKNTLKSHHGRNCGYSSLKHVPNILGALDALSGDSCKKLIAMSKCNLQMQIDFLQHFPNYYCKIRNKLTYLHPPQPLLVDKYESKELPLDGEIRFLFVGRSFFRKGGLELLETLQEARKNKAYSLKLTIVSSLEPDDYATGSNKEDVERVKKFIYENRDWVEYRESLENQQVLELMKNTHIGLLPTYADTYGYSALEFQAAGCPVISTNVRALPEINNNKRGWIIKVPKNRLGEAIYTTQEDQKAISTAIRKGLISAITEIMNNRQIISRKANASIKYIKEEHSPVTYAKKIEELYQFALTDDSVPPLRKR